MPFFKMGKTVANNLIHKPSTRRYPYEPAKSFKNSRGHITVDLTTCVYCGLCKRKCPTQAIAVSLNEKTFRLEELQCINCGYCVEVCPKKSLKMETFYNKSVSSKNKKKT